MAFFFLVVGLEIKRELMIGELRRPARRVPSGGRRGRPGWPSRRCCTWRSSAAERAPRGWGIPMATDVAFALGVLALAAARVPSGLRPLLLAIAIVDDIGSVVVVAAVLPGRDRDRSGSPCAVGVAGLVFVLREDADPGRSRLRHPRRRSLVRDVPRRAPPCARRGRHRPPDAVGAGATGRGPSAHARRARPVARCELRRPAAVRAREHGGRALGLLDRVRCGQHRGMGDPRRAGGRQAVRDLGRRDARVEAPARRPSGRRAIGATSPGSRPRRAPGSPCRLFVAEVAFGRDSPLLVAGRRSPCWPRRWSPRASGFLLLAAGGGALEPEATRPTAPDAAKGT